MLDPLDLIVFEDFIEDFSENSEDPELVWDDDDETSICPKRKRRRVRRNKVGSIPRVLMLDIRKCYAKMLVNVMNSQDFPLLFGFLDTYFAPNARHSSTKIVKHGDQRKRYSMNVYGCEEIAKYWYSFMNLSPDGVTTLNEATIQHTTGKVVSTLHKDGTQIFELCDRSNTTDYVEYILIDEHQHHQDKDSFGCQEKLNEIENTKKRKKTVCDLDEKLLRMRGIMTSVETAVSRLVLRKCPVAISMNGTFTILTDENKRIIGIEAFVEY